MDNSCWIIRFSNGSKLLLPEELYKRFVYDLAGEGCIEAEEHWFLESKAREKNSDAIIVR